MIKVFFFQAEVFDVIISNNFIMTKTKWFSTTDISNSLNNFNYYNNSYNESYNYKLLTTKLVGSNNDYIGLLGFEILENNKLKFLDDNEINSFDRTLLIYTNSESYFSSILAELDIYLSYNQIQYLIFDKITVNRVFNLILNDNLIKNIQYLFPWNGPPKIEPEPEPETELQGNNSEDLKFYFRLPSNDNYLLTNLNKDNNIIYNKKNKQYE